MNTKLNVRIENKADTEENWKAKNPILLKGEIGFILDGKLTALFKMGDGVTHWNDLKYAFAEINLINTSSISENTTLDETFLNKAILVTAECNITIPSINEGFNCIIKNISSDTVTIIPSEVTIDDSNSNIFLNKNEFISIVQNQNKYYVINTNKFHSAALGEFTIDDGVLSNSEITL